MKKLLLAATLLVFALLTACEVDDGTRDVTFKVKAQNVGDSSAVYIVGNHQALGMWNPGKVVLEKDDDGNWVRTVEFRSGESVEYKFTKGAWDVEAVYDDGSVPLNYILKVANDTTVEVAINHWRDEFKYKRVVVGQVTGNVEYYDSLKYKDLAPRNMIVWLPPGYETDTDKRYPVFYMHDGQNIIDPETSSMGYDWRVDEVADSLINIGEIEPVIIVGLTSTVNRYPEYSYTDTGYVYMDFLAEHVKPMIDSKYRTKPGRENTAVGGASMGGLISMMLVMEKGDVFSKAAVMSPALKVRRFDYVSRVKAMDEHRKDITMYIDNGGLGLEAEIQPGVDEMLHVLDSLGYEKGEHYYTYFDEDAPHNEIAWAERVWRPLTLFFGKNK